MKLKKINLVILIGILSLISILLIQVNWIKKSLRIQQTNIEINEKKDSLFLKQFTEKRLQDPSLLNLASKVSYEINPDDEYPKNYTGDITIFNKNGTTLSANQNWLRGGKLSPLKEEEVYRKFEENLKFSNVKSDKIKKLSHE